MRLHVLMITGSVYLASVGSADAQEHIDAPPAQQARGDSSDDMDDLITPEERAKFEATKRGSQNSPLSPETAAAYWAEQRARYDYWKTYWGRRQRVFEWQHTSGVVLFWSVVLMTFVGLGMAMWQFAKDKPAAGQVAHTLEISRDGLKLSSSFAGLVVVAVSFGFLYLYLREVYPINFVPEGTAAAAVDASD
jgi:hypothetical protein